MDGYCGHTTGNEKDRGERRPFHAGWLVAVKKLAPPLPQFRALAPRKPTLEAGMPGIIHSGPRMKAAGGLALFLGKQVLGCFAERRLRENGECCTRT